MEPRTLEETPASIDAVVLPTFSFIPDSGNALTGGRRAWDITHSPTAHYRTPRPPNAFILFRSAFSRRVSIDARGLSGMSRMASHAWRNLTTGERDKWDSRAAKAREAHRVKYPDYWFVPLKRSIEGCRGKEGHKHGTSAPTNIGLGRNGGALSHMLGAGAKASTQHDEFGDVPPHRPSGSAKQTRLHPCSSRGEPKICDCVAQAVSLKACDPEGEDSGEVSVRRDASPTPKLGTSSFGEGSRVTYSISNTYYGTVNNVGHIERATFGKADGTPGIESRTYVPPPVLVERSSTKVPNPPHSFLMFCSAMALAHYRTESVTLADEDASNIVLETWSIMSSGDRARIAEEAERSEELHLAILGSAGMPVRGKLKKEKYWSFVDQITDFCLEKWSLAQVAVKEHFKRLGNDLLLLHSDFTEVRRPARSPRDATQSLGCGRRASVDEKKGRVGSFGRLLARVVKRKAKARTAGAVSIVA